MSAPVVALKDALVDAINDRTWSLTFTAVGRYLPVKILAENLTNNELCVSVVPRPTTKSRETRGANRSTVEIDIGIQKKLLSADPADVDPLVNLADEIADWATGTSFDSIGLKRVGTEEFEFDQASLDAANVFMSVIRLTYIKIPTVA